MSQLPTVSNTAEGTTGWLDSSTGGGVVWTVQWFDGGRRGLSRTVGEGVGRIDGCVCLVSG
jgi:hypothetical protein